jgi:hypothetical protein
MGLFGLGKKHREEQERQQREALYRKGMDAYHSHDLTGALALLEQAAQQGHAMAQYQCAIMYGYRSHPDLEKAFYWAQQAADQGVVEAAVMVVELKRSRASAQAVVSSYPTIEPGMDAFLSGDHAKALSLLEQAAREGSADAQHLCGGMYYKGIGTAQDFEKALSWYEAAAQQGHAKAQYSYAYLFLKEDVGDMANIEQAADWLQAAANQTEDLDTREQALALIQLLQ